MTAVRVADNLDRVRERIEAACHAAGRSASGVRLVAVSKRIDLDLVAAACAAGQWDLGENRVDEALRRQDELPPLLAARGLDPERLRWHFIGHLQGNKARRAAGRFVLMHGVHSLKLAARLAGLAADAGRTESVLLEVNISGEPQKHGVEPDAAPGLAAEIAALPGLDLRGLMGMARFGAAEAELRGSFATLRRAAEDARRASGRPLPELSMGMSGDFVEAVLEGATLVRVGGAIFGPRGDGNTA
jgi:pyridoxal phosphate enzyme (YggS family)